MNHSAVRLFRRVIPAMDCCAETARTMGYQAWRLLTRLDAPSLRLHRIGAGSGPCEHLPAHRARSVLSGRVALWRGIARGRAVDLGGLADRSGFLSLGYLLESSARVARTGRLRDGLIGVRKAARIGGFAAGTWLSLVPAWLVGSMARSAELIDPAGRVARSGGSPWLRSLSSRCCISALRRREAGGSGTSFGRSGIRSGWFAVCGAEGSTPNCATSSGISPPACEFRITSSSDWSVSWERWRGCSSRVY